MLVKLTLIVLWTTFTFRVAFAQADLGTLPRCAQNCVAAVANAKNCILLTQQCLCPAELDIHLCISRACPMGDLSSSNTIVSAFCQTAPTTPGSPAFPPVITPTQTPPLPPTPSTTTVLLPPPLSSLSIPTIPSSSTSSTTSTTSSSIIITPTPTPSSLTTSEAQQTVVVFSTEFAPPAPFTSSSSLSVRLNAGVMLLSGIIGVLVA